MEAQQAKGITYPISRGLFFSEARFRFEAKLDFKSQNPAPNPAQIKQPFRLGH